MKIRLTFELDDTDRRAIAVARKHKRIASRTECVQFITQTVSEQGELLRRNLRLHDARLAAAAEADQMPLFQAAPIVA